MHCSEGARTALGWSRAGQREAQSPLQSGRKRRWATNTPMFIRAPVQTWGYPSVAKLTPGGEWLFRAYQPLVRKVRQKVVLLILLVLLSVIWLRQRLRRLLPEWLVRAYPAVAIGSGSRMVQEGRRA